jgi:hypothetical protein
LAFRKLADPKLSRVVGTRNKIDHKAYALFDGPTLPEKLVRALARHNALPVKEVLESFEFFQRVRRRLRARMVADLCCGHGLTGALFAVFCRGVEEVVLLDKEKPPSHTAVMSAIDEVAPWAVKKTRFVLAPLARAERHVEQGASIVAVHACGKRTDRCLDLAVAVGGRAAVMPCCYARTADTVPVAVRDALGKQLATDVDRTYRLESAGYDVDWTWIPRQVTDKNRVLVAIPRHQRGAARSC